MNRFPVSIVFMRDRRIDTTAVCNNPDANNTVSSQLLQLTVAAAQYRLPQQTTDTILPGTTTKTVDPGPLPIR